MNKEEYEKHIQDLTEDSKVFDILANQIVPLLMLIWVLIILGGLGYLLFLY